jgi:hypothetical protein
MRPLLKRLAARLIIANLLVIPVLLLLITLTSSNAAAADISGTWSSNVAGRGYIQTSLVLDTNYDVELVLSQSGNAVSGTIVTTCSYSYLHSGYANWGSPAIGQESTNTVSGTLSGNALTLISYTPASSGVSNGISYTTAASTITWHLNLNGSRLTGSGTYTSAGITYSYIYDLKSGDSSSGLDLGSGSVTVPAVIAIIGGGACMVTSFMPLPKGRVPKSGPTGNASNYQPSEVLSNSVDSGAPTEATPVGGAGLQYPQDYVNGVPVRPKFWQSQQHGPVCPVHGTMCIANYLSSEDPGAWFCPKCAEQGHGSPPSSGFPWGRK